MKYYRIKNWDTIYEVNRNRELKSVKWIALPVKLSGDGYCMLMEDEKGNRRKEGPEMFGTFIALVEISATCTPRGSFLKSSGDAHTFESLGRICRILPMVIEKTILFCVEKLNWIEIIDLKTGCDNSASSSHQFHSSCGIGADAPVCNVMSVLSVKEEGVQGGKEKTWRTDYQIYLDQCNAAFDKILDDWNWIAERKQYHPGLKIRKSVEKMFFDYWGTPAGWKKKKASRTAEIDWTDTVNYGLSLKCNQVWLQKDEVDEEIEYIYALKRKKENAEEKK